MQIQQNKNTFNEKGHKFNEMKHVIKLDMYS